MAGGATLRAAARAVRGAAHFARRCGDGKACSKWVEKVPNADPINKSPRGHCAHVHITTIGGESDMCGRRVWGTLPPTANSRRLSVQPRFLSFFEVREQRSDQ